MLSRVALRQQSLLHVNSISRQACLPRCTGVWRYNSTVSSKELPPSSTLPGEQGGTPKASSVLEQKEQGSSSEALPPARVKPGVLVITKSKSKELLSATTAKPDIPEINPEELTEEQLASTPFHGRSLIEPLRIPSTYGIPVASIQFRSYWPPLLNLFTHFAAHAASALGIPTTRVLPLPKRRELWTVPKGPFVHKKSQENFERITHKRMIKAYDTDWEVINRWVTYLEKNALAGVGMRVVRWERAPVGVGQKIHDVVQEAARGQHPEKAISADGRQEVLIQAVADKIIEKELAAVQGQPELAPPPKDGQS